MASQHEVAAPFSTEEVYRIIPTLRGRKEELVKLLCTLATKVNQHMKDTGLTFREACKEVFAAMHIDSFSEKGAKLRKATSRMLNRRSVEIRRRRAGGSTKKSAPKRRNKGVNPSLPSPPPKKVEPLLIENKRVALAQSMGQRRFAF